MKFTSAERYTIKTAWVEESGIASKSLDNNDLVLKDLLLDIMDGKELDSASLDKLHTLINEKNAENAPVAIEPEEFTWGLYVGECPNGEILA